MKRFVIEQSDKEFYTSHSGLALVGACLNRFVDCNGKRIIKVKTPFFFSLTSTQINGSPLF